jgi:hypothetical protein
MKQINNERTFFVTVGQILNIKDDFTISHIEL